MKRALKPEQIQSIVKEINAYLASLPSLREYHVTLLYRAQGTVQDIYEAFCQSAEGRSQTLVFIRTHSNGRLFPLGTQLIYEYHHEDISAIPQDSSSPL